MGTRVGMETCDQIILPVAFHHEPKHSEPGLRSTQGIVLYRVMSKFTITNPVSTKDCPHSPLVEMTVNWTHTHLQARLIYRHSWNTWQSTHVESYRNNTQQDGVSIHNTTICQDCMNEASQKFRELAKKI